MWIAATEALRLVREKRALEIYEDGKFLGLKLCVSPLLGNEPGVLLPPAELPGLLFDDPNPERKYARFHWRFI